MNQTLPKTDRITRKDDFTRIIRTGAHAADGTMRLFAKANALGRARVGLAVSGRHGNAVRRNRVKRLCREAFRLHRDELPPGIDFIIMPHASADLTLGSIAHALVNLAARLAEGIDDQ